MAYRYAFVCERVASAGRKAFSLPLYTNLCLKTAGNDGHYTFPAEAGANSKPSDYPSGGAFTNVLDIWIEFAHSLDFISPDIYFDNYSKVCVDYRHRGNTLFIPEQRRDEYGARRIWTACGSYHALGCSPFGIDTLDLENNPFRRHYSLLKKITPYIVAARARSHAITVFYFDEIQHNSQHRDVSPPNKITRGNFKLEASPPAPPFLADTPPTASGL